MNTKNILIVYNNIEFISRLLKKLYPDKFSRDYSITQTPIDIIIVDGDWSIRVSAQLGLNKTNYRNIDEVYVESSLVKGEGKKILEEYPIEKDRIKIIKFRGL